MLHSVELVLVGVDVEACRVVVVVGHEHRLVAHGDEEHHHGDEIKDAADDAHDEAPAQLPGGLVADEDAVDSDADDVADAYR